MTTIIVRLVRPFAVLALAAFSSPSALAQEVPPLAAYGELPGVEDMAISRSGKHLAVFTTLGETRQVIVFDDELNSVRRATVDDMKFRGFNFVGDEALLIVRSETVDVSGFVADKYEISQGLVLPLQNNAQAALVFGGTSAVMNAVFGNYGLRASADGWQGFFGAVEYGRNHKGDRVFEHGRPALYRYDFATGGQRRVARAPAEGVRRKWLVDGAGEVAAELDVIELSGSWTIRNSANRTLAEGRDLQGNVGLVGLGARGDTVIYVQRDQQSGNDLWFEVPLAGGEAQPFLADVAIDRFYWDPANGQLLGYLADEEGAEPVMFDAELQHRAQMVERAFAGNNARIMEWTPDFSKVIVHTQGSQDSGTWFLVDVDARKAEPFGYDRPLIGSDQVGPVSTLAYTAQDGLEMDAVVTLPPGREAAGLPVVVLPHGGPHMHDAEGFDWWAQAFASRGYAVIQPNFRGSTGRGQDFERAGYGEWGRKMQTDISDALAALAEQGVVDPSRACIVGASYGGYAALAGVTLQQGLYRCAVSVAGIGDIGLMYRTENRESGRNPLFRRSLREELGDSRGWDAISPRRFAAQADAPILLIHGRDDTVVNFEQSARMADALKDAGKPYRLVELAGEDHWLSLAVTRQQMLTETMAFVQEHNPAD
ncbi:S9 family peptidase [Aurantiacibacter xanthus]|uniref:S9 family peptidase n=1 Tax=Aurantiacibacter xanthus TaxID=1784712 RepID=A0A3A1P5B5_9SPHN|nr:alpha/beta fold hydrolase [Aurantiacibacter xanthus]RIV88659.1 S9 family peptidase [Aurantiacibacter xanthus]